MIKELQDHVAREIGPIAKPKIFASVRTCPRRDRARSCAASCVPLAKGETVRRTFSTLEIRRSWNSSGVSLFKLLIVKDFDGVRRKALFVCRVAGRFDAISSTKRHQ